jgi:hypothetical protein
MAPIYNLAVHEPMNLKRWNSHGLEQRGPPGGPRATYDPKHL